MFIYLHFLENHLVFLFEHEFDTVIFLIVTMCKERFVDQYIYARGQWEQLHISDFLYVIVIMLKFVDTDLFWRQITFV